MRFRKIKSTRPVQEQKNLYDFELAQRILSGQNGVIGRVNSIHEGRRALRTAEETIRNLPHEHTLFFNTDGEIFHATDKSPDGINVEDIVPRKHLQGSVGTHNHPKEWDDGGFSMDDYNLFKGNNMALLRGVDDRSTFSLRESKRPGILKPLEERKTLSEIRNEKLASRQDKLDRDMEAERDIAYDEANKEYAKENGLRVWRRHKK